MQLVVAPTSLHQRNRNKRGNRRKCAGRLFEIKDLAAFGPVFAAADLGLQQLPKLKIDVESVVEPASYFI
jgi:hypothetical protein